MWTTNIKQKYIHILILAQKLSARWVQIDKIKQQRITGKIEKIQNTVHLWIIAYKNILVCNIFTLISIFFSIFLYIWLRIFICDPFNDPTNRHKIFPNLSCALIKITNDAKIVYESSIFYCVLYILRLSCV